MIANATSIDYTVNCSNIAHSVDSSLLSSYSSCDNDSYVHLNSISNSFTVPSTQQSFIKLLQSTALQLNAGFDLNDTTVIASNATLNATSGPDQEYINFLELTRFWIQRVFVPLLMIIGVVGNSMTIIIMTRRRMRSSTNCYLAALATFDMLYLIFVFVLSLQHYPDMDDVKYFYYWKVFPFFLMIVDACTNISVWLTVTFTIERFIVVSHPIKGKVICTESRAKKVILCVFLICFTFVIPTPFEWVIVENVDPQTNRTYITPDASEFGRNQLYKIVFSWVYSILFVFIPLLLLAVFNSFLIRSVHLSKKQRSVMTQSKLRNPGKSSQTSDTNNVTNARSGGKFDQSSKQETKITVMLISVVILFLICQLPVAGMLIYTSVRTVPPKTNEFYLLTGLNNIFNFMVAVNAAGNFVLYCLLSEKYRRTLVKLFCPCLKGKLSHLQSSYHQTLYSKTTGAGKFGFETEDQTEFRNFDGCKRGSSASPQAMKNVLEAKAAEERKLLKATRNSSNRKPANNNNSNSNQRSNVSVLPIINVNKHCCDSSGTGNSLDTSCDVEIRDVSKTVGETRNDCDVSEKE